VSAIVAVVDYVLFNTAQSLQSAMQQSSVNAYKYFSSNRVCVIWNSLPNFVVEASFSDNFRRLLNQVDLPKFVVLQ